MDRVPASPVIGPALAASAVRRPPTLRLLRVSKTYRTTSGQVTALKSIAAEFYPGEFVAIIGKSGAGKSTLVNMITGVDHLTSGEVWMGETALHTLDEDALALWRGRNVGIVYQTFQLLPNLSLLRNVLLPMDFCGLYRPRQSEQRALRLLADVGLQGHEYKRPGQISGGQQQRVAIARALANDPPLIVADEPTGSLDSATAEAIFTVFQGLVTQGRTLIMVTHDESLAARASRVLRLVDGEIMDERTN